MRIQPRSQLSSAIISLSSKPPVFSRTARTGVETRLLRIELTTFGVLLRVLKPLSYGRLCGVQCQLKCNYNVIITSAMCDRSLAPIARSLLNVCQVYERNLRRKLVVKFLALKTTSFIIVQVSSYRYLEYFGKQI